MLLSCLLRQLTPRCAKRVNQQILPHRNSSRVERQRWASIPCWTRPIPFLESSARPHVCRGARDGSASSSRQRDFQAAPCWSSALSLLAVRQESAYLSVVSPRRFLAIAGRVTNSAKPLPVQHTGPAAISLAGLFRCLQSLSRTTVPRRDLIRPACGATLKKSTKADH